MVAASPGRSPAELVPSLAAVPGYFTPRDAAFFVAVHEEQRRRGTDGDLLEIGVSEGRSAVLLGALAADHEEVVLCDVWGHEVGAPPADPTQVRGARRFLETYRQRHARDPRLVVASSDQLAGIGLSATFRLAHIDGSHDHDVVGTDADLVAGLLQPAGIVAFDDIASRAWPGVAAAVWPRVAAGVFVPVLLTDDKLYVTTDAAAADEWLEVLRGVAETLAGTTCASLSIAGREVLHCRRVPTTASTVHRLGRAVARGVRRGEG